LNGVRGRRKQGTRVCPPTCNSKSDSPQTAYAAVTTIAGIAVTKRRAAGPAGTTVAREFPRRLTRIAIPAAPAVASIAVLARYAISRRTCARPPYTGNATIAS
jgi:hypothetical protein